MMRIINLRSSPSMLKQLRHTGTSSNLSMQPIASMQCSGDLEKAKSDTSISSVVTKDKQAPISKEKGKLVTAAFEKLKLLETPQDMDDSVTKLISEAQNLDGLLSIVKIRKLTKHHALKIVAVLADWTVEGKVKTADFEKDSRFASVCSLLGSSPKFPDKQTKSSSTNSQDLNTVLGVASDDEAAKLVSNISLPQMIKVLSTLASKKRRSTLLLRSLAFNISSSTEKLDIKQCADTLYAVASLNFHDEVLVERVCADLCSCLMNNSRRAVVGSVIKSLGLLRYKHLDLLNLLCQWVEKHKDTCTPQDLSSLLLTLAVVNHLPDNHQVLFPIILDQLVSSGVSDPYEWLDVVWSLTVLNKETTEQLKSVLSSEFIEKIQALNPGLTIPVKLKLLNINGAAKLRRKYQGPLLDMSQDWKVPLLRSKEKQSLVVSVQETMMNLLPSTHYLATNIETDMGFIIDVECVMTTKFSPLPLFDKKTKERIDRSGPDTQKGIKVAVLVWDYHDMTHGRKEPTGVTKLYQDLTHLMGYRVAVVDFVDFNPRSKLTTRVQYLNQKLKASLGIS
ncbi:uncharacterized protein LOC128998632 isoform X2 [Macrosteles quadrilineatus]|uniref:uncharacterized protein LOC128998632 isoform X2 n=1 Tax=Macrosteles quadrilineatus TaxID=74068 RepID=UPI0023E152F6|nr:uncharacterized protein LOC128998632 isoform X2 [Macrosteles quadrilineatus]